MKEYRVCFTKYDYFTITAENEDEAIKLAEEEFCSWYDEVEVWEEDE